MCAKVGGGVGVGQVDKSKGQAMSVCYHCPIISLAYDSLWLTASELPQQGCHGDAASEERAPAAGEAAAVFITCWKCRVAPGKENRPHTCEHATCDAAHRASKSLCRCSALPNDDSKPPSTEAEPELRTVSLLDAGEIKPFVM